MVGGHSVIRLVMLEAWLGGGGGGGTTTYEMSRLSKQEFGLNQVNTNALTSSSDPLIPVVFKQGLASCTGCSSCLRPLLFSSHSLVSLS